MIMDGNKTRHVHGTVGMDDTRNGWMGFGYRRGGNFTLGFTVMRSWDFLVKQENHNNI
jgi:hypothetical protein